MRTVELRGDVVRLIDQTALPASLRYVECRTVEDVACAIRGMQVRGAPAIGVSAAFGLVLAGLHSRATEPAALLADLNAAASRLRETRPTAVNLSWALERGLEAACAAAPAGVATM